VKSVHIIEYESERNNEKCKDQDRISHF
jgi:hypothetical protein